MSKSAHVLNGLTGLTAKPTPSEINNLMGQKSKKAKKLDQNAALKKYFLHFETSFWTIRQYETHNTQVG